MHETFETIRRPNVQITRIDEAEAFNKILEKKNKTISHIKKIHIPLEKISIQNTKQII